MKWEYKKIDVEKTEKSIQEQLEKLGWELFSIRANNDGTYVIFRRPK